MGRAYHNTHKTHTTWRNSPATRSSFGRLRSRTWLPSSRKEEALLGPPIPRTFRYAGGGGAEAGMSIPPNRGSMPAMASLTTASLPAASSTSRP